MRKKMLKPFCFLLFLLVSLPLGVGFAEAAPDREMAPPHVKLAYSEGSLQAGSTLQIHVSIEHGWHITSHQPSDEFLVPARVEVFAEGIEFGTPAYPEPDIQWVEALQMENSIFHGEFTIKVPVSAVSASFDSLSTRVVFHYQSCNSVLCLPPASVETTLGSEQLFLDEQQGANKESGSGEGADTPGGGAADSPDGATEGAAAEASAAEQAQVSANKPASGIVWMLFLAFLGGLILNLMPCVLPVLSLKVMSLVKQSGESRGRVFALTGMMTLGILASFWVLAGVIILLQQGGNQVGWGFQFQNPVFLFVMIAIIIVFALNLWGLFEIGVPVGGSGMQQASAREGLQGAFFKGVFMTLLSTPCSAPFLGSALGYALVQPPSVLLLFFTAIALGLATPYALFAFFPSWLKILPKPGNWMIRLRQFLGFTLLVTALWLLWVLGKQQGMDAVFAVSVLLSIAALGLWIYGFAIQPRLTWKSKIIWLLAFHAVMIPFWLGFVKDTLLLPPAAEVQNVSSVSGINAQDLLNAPAGEWVAFNESVWTKIQENGRLKLNRVVFVDFTADWCLTCKVNERAVLARQGVQTAFKDLDVLTIKGDWTRKDPYIGSVLQDFGRSGVPVYLVFGPGLEGADGPIILPEVLTEDLVVRTLEQAAGVR